MTDATTPPTAVPVGTKKASCCCDQYADFSWIDAAPVSLKIFALPVQPAPEKRTYLTGTGAPSQASVTICPVEVRSTTPNGSEVSASPNRSLLASKTLRPGATAPPLSQRYLVAWISPASRTLSRSLSMPLSMRRPAPKQPP